MNYTKEQIISLAKKILDDIELEYYDDKEPFVEYGLAEAIDKERGFVNIWSCNIKCYDWQFDSDEGAYCFVIDDEQDDLIFFIDASGGQIPHAYIKKDEDGKYYREYIPR